MKRFSLYFGSLLFAATAIATVLLRASFVMLGTVTLLERWSRRWDS